MASVFLGLGSNIEPARNLQQAVSELRRRFGAVRTSCVYRNKAVGFEGDDFLNLVAHIDTDLPAHSVCEFVEQIHDMSGRTRGSERFSSRPLDIDLLLYDDLVLDEPPVHVPREDILEYSFVLLPLAELAGDVVHPQTGRTIAQHLREFDLSCHPLSKQDVIL